jgi:hypothetical protein
MLSPGTQQNLKIAAGAAAAMIVVGWLAVLAIAALSAR